MAVVGCGTSFYMAQAYAALREAAGRGAPRRTPPASTRAPATYDHVVAISRSGTTTEVIELLQALRERGPGDHRHRRDAGHRHPGAGQPRSCPWPRSTSSPSCRPASRRPPWRSCAPPSARTSRRAIADAEAVLAEDEASALGAVQDVEQITFVGRGWTVGLAHEAALKLRESAQFWTESYPAMEYRHGPISIATHGRATWAFGEVPVGLADDVAATGAVFEHRDIDPLADLVRAAAALPAQGAPRRAWTRIDPRHLSRSIILT